jgi:hypothetical protein
MHFPSSLQESPGNVWSRLLAEFHADPTAAKANGSIQGGSGLA